MYTQILKDDAPLILSIDTATQVINVAVTLGTRVIAVSDATAEAPHVSQLLDCIDQILRKANVALKDINLLAAAIGPGSFTGLRTGVSTTKAFAATLSIPVAPIRTLHAISIAEGAPKRFIMALLPAGRKEVFAQKLTFDESSDIAELSEPRHVAPEKLLHENSNLDHSILWVGDGSRQISAHLQARAKELGVSFNISDVESVSGSESDGWQVASPSKTPLAVSIAYLALRLSYQCKLVAANDLRAMYVRPSDVELKEIAR